MFRTTRSPSSSLIFSQSPLDSTKTTQTEEGTIRYYLIQSVLVVYRRSPPIPIALYYELVRKADTESISDVEEHKQEVCSQHIQNAIRQDMEHGRLECLSVRHFGKL